MMTKQLTVLLFLFSFFCKNHSYGFAGIKHPAYGEFLMVYGNLKLTEVVKLSYAEITQLTGKRYTVWDKLSVRFLKTCMKKEIKKNPGITLSEFYHNQKKPLVFRILSWIIIGILVLLLIMALLYSGAGK